jgi:hypothetical protein
MFLHGFPEWSNKTLDSPHGGWPPSSVDSSANPSPRAIHPSPPFTPPSELCLPNFAFHGPSLHKNVGFVSVRHLNKTFRLDNNIAITSNYFDWFFFLTQDKFQVADFSFALMRHKMRLITVYKAITDDQNSVTMVRIDRKPSRKQRAIRLGADQTEDVLMASSTNEPTAQKEAARKEQTRSMHLYPVFFLLLLGTCEF